MDADVAVPSGREPLRDLRPAVLVGPRPRTVARGDSKVIVVI